VPTTTLKPLYNMDKIRFGMTGTGRITDWVLKGAVLEPRFTVAAVCSRSQERAEAFAASHGIPKAYSDFTEMVCSPDIDAVYIGTPNDTHKSLAIKAMEHGKHVLCEKPLGVSTADVEEMSACAKENGVLLMEAMISTLSPNFLEVQRRAKSMGRPRNYFSAFCQYSSKCGTLKKILSGEEPGPVPSSFNPEHGGGALMDVGIYTIYPMVVLFGEPRSISAHGLTVKVPTGKGPMPTDLGGSAVFGYDGMEAEIIYSKIADSRLRTEISFDDGIISLDQIHVAKDVWMTRRGAPTSGRNEGPLPEDITVPSDPDPYLCEFREFIDVLQSGRRESANNSLGNSLAVARILDECRRQML
jgi:predicted dehydrogenase